MPIALEGNRTETSQVFGISFPTIDQWVKDGCPHKRVGRNVIFVFSEVFKWRLGRVTGEISSEKIELTEERAKLAKAQRERIEMEMAERGGELCEVAEVRAKTYDHLRTFRDGMMALPPRLAPLLVGATDQHTIERTLSREMRTVCDQLADSFLG